MPDRIFFDIYAERVLIESPIYILGLASIFLVWRYGADYKKARLLGIAGLALIVFGQIVEPFSNRMLWDSIRALSQEDRNRLISQYVNTYNFVLSAYRASSAALIVWALVLSLRKCKPSTQS